MPSNATDLVVDGVVNADKVFEALQSVTKSMDVMFILFSGYIVFMMQAGFAMLTAGSVRSKNTKNVLLKNMLDACVGAVGFFLFGYSFAYGPKSNQFIGWGHFALSSEDGVPFARHESFFFQWAFAATAATIVSGSVAERTSFYAYLFYAFVLISFVYPVVAHWVWGGGWLSTVFGAGTIDFAGCIVVHTVGGWAGLAGAVIVGPRLGRFDSEGKVVPIPGHSATLVTLGTFILWFGWYGFNPGSTLAISGTFRETAARAAVNTTLAASSAGITTLIVVKARDGIYDLLASLNGILAGLVSITACCAFVDGWAALLIGSIGACVFVAWSMVILAAKIDDPLDAFPIHGGCGMWGALAGALFNRRVHQQVGGYSTSHWGLFYGGGGKLLASNVVGVISVVLWTLATIGPLFLVMKVIGVLRISAEEEIIGNDVSKHGGVAYPIDSAVAAEKAAAREIDHLGMDESL
jgi:ammonium transporter, Amt family